MTEPSPQSTLGKIREWLGQRSFDSIGIATFGPVDARIDSPRFGYITSTLMSSVSHHDMKQVLDV